MRSLALAEGAGGVGKGKVKMTQVVANGVFGVGRRGDMCRGQAVSECGRQPRDGPR